MTDKLSVDARYQQICENIRFTDSISFKLLGFVPLISTGSITGLVTTLDASNGWYVFYISLFAALITYFLFMWELRNISKCNVLICEREKLEHEIHATKKTKNKLKNCRQPKNRGCKAFLRFGKTEAEKGLYALVVMSWLPLPLVLELQEITVFKSSCEIFVWRIMLMIFLVLLIFAVLFNTKKRVQSS